MAHVPGHTRGKVFSGPRALITIGGVEVGFLQDVSGEESLEYLPVDVIGDIFVKEHVPVAVRVSFSASLVRIVGDTLRASGIWPKLGDGTSKKYLENVLDQLDLTILVQDQITGESLYSIIGGRMTSRSFSVSARGIVGKNISFVGLKMKDESETALAT